MKIRNYQESDKERLRYICKETAWEEYKKDTARLESVCIMFCDYFAEQEPQHIFILADGENQAVGYIICSADYENFCHMMNGEYMRRLEKTAPGEKLFLQDFLKKLEQIKEHPVHFHIDLLPEYQRQGWGRKLMTALCEQLWKEGITDLSGCSSNRKSDGYQMYKKLGFTEIYDYGNDVVSINLDIEKFLNGGRHNMTMRERIVAGKLFTDECEGMPEERRNCKKHMMVFNNSSAENMQDRMEAMEDLFGKKLKAWIEPPFYCCYGTNISIGEGSYLNFNCNFVDDGKITIGKKVMVGPAVTIATVGHPIHPELREYMYTDEVEIGDNCWIGAGVTICPGVHIGENTVIGAGSVVTKDIPANSVAVGNPCQVIREIDERDNKYYYKNRKIDKADLEEERRLRGEK